MTSWLLFFVFVVLGITLVCLPGFLVLRGFRFDWQDCVSFAPSLSIFFYCVAGICLSFFGVFATWLTMLAFTALEVGLLLIIGRLVACEPAFTQVATVNNKQTWLYMAAYLIFGFAITTFVFAKALDGPYSFCSSSDYSYHLSLVRSFIDSGSFSTLHCGLYPETIRSAGFYPAAWHVFSALLASLSGSVSMAGNIANFVVMAFILPMGCFALLGRIFSNNAIALSFGSFLCLSFVGYPWIFLVWGQLSSNLMSFALVPSFVALFWDLLEDKSLREFVVNLLALLSCAAAITFAQTNGLFTAGVFCIPLIFRFTSLKFNAMKKASLQARILVYIGAAAAIAAVWLFAYKAPFMQGVVGVNRSYDLNFIRAVKNVLKLQFGSLSGSQLLLGVVVLLGLIAAVRSSKYRALALLYLGVVFIYVINDACVGDFQHLISGFWYNDYYRTGAMVALAAIPLACLGLNSLVDLFGLLFIKLKKPSVALIALAFVAGNFLPSLGFLELPTSEGMSKVEANMSNLYSMDYQEGVTAEEWSFIEEAHKIVGNSVVLNISVDGSGFCTLTTV